MRSGSLILALFLWSTLGGVTAASAPVPPSKRIFDGKCGAPVKSPEDAMAKADFVIEGTVTVAFFPDNAQLPVEVIIDSPKVIRERETSNTKTISLVLGPCFAQGLHPFIVKGSANVEGKRMRFFGNEHEFSPKRRFFYMQSADLPIPVSLETGPPWNAKNPQNKGHANDVNHPIGDGWHRARSTEGKFSIDLPAPYVDMTGVQNGVPHYILRSVDNMESIFMVVFAPSRKYSALAGTFDNEMRKPETIKSIFRGMPALHFRNGPDETTGAVMNGMWVRVPGGTYTFAVRTRKENEAQSVKARERFYSSIAFE